MEPVVVMDTILVVRPREVQFKWSFDKVAGTVSNTGNTRFKLLIKPGCDSTEEEGRVVSASRGRGSPAGAAPAGNHYLVYNDKFIKISDTCPLKPRPAGEPYLVVARRVKRRLASRLRPQHSR